MRSFQPELMDGDRYSRDEYLECLRQLRTLNKLTLGYGSTLQSIDRFSRKRGAEPLRILDIGFGFGDTLREIALWAKREDRTVELTGIDIQPLSESIARAETPSWMPITYLTGDVFAHAPAQPYDVVINALFMHHMNDEQTVRMLGWMRDCSRLGFFINDLHRHPVAHIFIRYFTRIFGFNRLVRHDAPLSVARSFRAAEWKTYAERAGLDLSRLRVRWHWNFRYGVAYEHP